jgi:hypothetical protein
LPAQAEAFVFVLLAACYLSLPLFPGRFFSGIKDRDKYSQADLEKSSG